MSKRKFSIGNEEKVLNKCPICGGDLEYCDLCQYSIVSRILKNGKLSKKKKRRDEGSMECGFINCTNCDFHTDCDLDSDEHKNIHIHQDKEVFKYEEDNE